MRKSGTLSYMLADHLGSTVATTNTSGQLVSGQLYKAWGEVRYSLGTSPTKYTYTGQYSNVSDFGLMFYNARWYDPVSGRFTQADTIVPQNQGVQAWDRYAYTNNNPVLYTDPSGHVGCKLGQRCVNNPQVTASGTIKQMALDGGEVDILPTSTPPAPIVAVPAPQPPGSPSVPTVTSVTTTSSTTVTVETAELGPIPLDNGYTISPQIPTSKIPGLSYVQNAMDILGLEHNGNDVQLPAFSLIPEELRLTKVVTVTKTTITTFDQYGESISSQTITNTTVESILEQNLSGFWVPYEPVAPYQPGTVR